MLHHKFLRLPIYQHPFRNNRVINGQMHKIQACCPLAAIDAERLTAFADLVFLAHLQAALCIEDS